MTAALTIVPSSTPSISQFNPKDVPYQYLVIRDVRRFYDYSQGVHEILLSGAVGSAKSILGAHLAITHCLMHERARWCWGRKAMPDLKSTILAKTLEHMEVDLVEGQDFEHNETSGKIEFANGSEILCRSWHDKKYKKFRSLELSGAGIEELTENDDQDKQAYDELKMRVGRLPHIKENFMISMTNPDDPGHWAHKYFIESDSPTRHVYYSVTTDNKFLPNWYVEQLLKDLDPKMAQRMIYGRWIVIAGEVIYYSYERAVNFRDREYKVDPTHPVWISYDFNIAENKPMSAIIFQYINDEFHFFDECVIDSARTESTLEEMAGRDLFEHGYRFLIAGDATGRSRHPSSKLTNYDIIREYLANYKPKSGNPIGFEIRVPRSNPPIRKRHIKVNAYFKNMLGQVRAYVYKSCKTADEGFRLTKLKKGADYIEDDSKPFQHITTAAGYGMIAALEESGRQPQRTLEL